MKFEKQRIGIWVKRFLMEHLIGERNLARNKQASYRDALALLLPFTAKRLKKAVDHICIEDIPADVIHDFLQYLEKKRNCTIIITRNQRLAAIHSLCRFIGERSSEHVVWCSELRDIPLKKTSNAAMNYLEKSEMNALINAPNRRTAQGARVDEAAHVMVGDLDLRSSPLV